MGWYSAGYCLRTAAFRMDCSVGKEVMAASMFKVTAYVFPYQRIIDPWNAVWVMMEFLIDF